MLTINDIKNIHFEPSSLCNARCPVCPRYLLGGVKNPDLSERAVSFEQFKQWFPVSTLEHIERIQMCGNYGDPGTTPDLIPIVEYILENNTAVVIHTNGGMRSTDFWKQLGKMSNDVWGDNLRVVFAIDGLEDTNHLYRRGVVWETLIKNVKAYISEGGYAIWNWLEFKHNEHQLLYAKDTLAKELGFKSFFSKTPFGFMDNRQDNNAVPSMLVLSKDGEYDYELYQAGVTETNNDIPGIPKLVKNTVIPERGTWEESVCNNKLSCHAQNVGEVYVSATGQVHPCCFLSGYPDAPYASWQNKQYTDLIMPHYEQLNLSNNTLDVILENEFFQTKMVQGMKPGPDRLIGCSVYCSKR